MTYLIGQMLLCLLAAAFLGFLLGWFLRGIGCRERVDALGAELDEARSRARQWENQAGEAEARAEAAVARAAASAPTAPAAEAEPMPAVPMADAPPSAPIPRYVPSFPVEEVEGIGAGFGKRLAALGVSSTATLLRESETDDGTSRMAEACQVNAETVGTWVTMADLLRIPGVGGQWAELLWRSGVRGVGELSGESPAPLLLRMTEINDAENRVPELPTLEQVEHWIAEAEAMSVEGGEDYVPSFAIEEIEGIGAGFGRRLRGEGIRTTEALLGLGDSPETLSRLAELCDVPADTVGGWLTMARLLRVPGVGGQWAELLWRSDVTGVQALADREAEALLDLVGQVNARENRVPELPDLDRVRHWVQEAGRMVG
jgi:predicted flap endonuclease-1-like 5' DNA nuclease